LKLNIYKFISIVLLLLTSTLPCLASNPIDDLVFTSQKYIVVTAVVLVIFIGIVIYLTILERRIKKVEDKQNKIH
jgi:hypothetical protein